MDRLFDSLWPVHLKPQPDELLSSWLIRLAHAHGYQVEGLCRLLLGRGAAMWNRDIDRCASETLMAAVMTATAATEPQFRNTLLSAYDGTLTESVGLSGTARWLVPLSVLHRKRRRPGLMYCSTCIATDPDPYCRKKWRLACITVCSTHGVELRDSCPNCNAAFVPHRVDMGHGGYMPSDKLLVKCHVCGHDLRVQSADRGDPKLVDFTRRIEECLQSGHFDISPATRLYSVAFMQGLRLLIRAIRKASGVKARGEGAPIQIPNNEFEHLPLCTRRLVMTELASLFSADVKCLADQMRRMGIRYSDVVTLKDETPFWLTEALTPLKRAQHPIRGDQERQRIADAVEARAGKINERSARMLFGVSLEMAKLPVGYRSLVSDDAYELLMASVDQSVGATFDKRRRMAYLQDKVIFALLRTSQMTTTQIAGLEVQDVKASDQPAEFSVEARTEEEALAWTRWHVANLRPELVAVRSCSHVFVSAFTSKPLGATGVQRRFWSAVERAGLGTSIRGIEAFRKRV